MKLLMIRLFILQEQLRQKKTNHIQSLLHLKEGGLRTSKLDLLDIEFKYTVKNDTGVSSNVMILILI